MPSESINSRRYTVSSSKADSFTNFLNHMILLITRTEHSFLMYYKKCVILTRSLLDDKIITEVQMKVIQ